MSAGGVVYREREGIIEVVLVARPADGLWALPKGTPEAGESVEQTALREVREETGLAVVIAGSIGSIRYQYALRGGGRVQKIVHHYLMRAVGGDVALHDHEYDVVDWVDIHEAVGRVSFANERSILERAGALIQETS
jgi:8-oxo-dGTP pyrophosphatase MutT (NUDIX family)